MTPRVQRTSFVLTLIALGGVIVVTSLGAGIRRLDVTLPMGAYVCGALATWLVLFNKVVALVRAGARAAPSTGEPLSAATWVTLGRGVLVSAVGGFALGAAPGGVARWAPGFLYALAALGDGLDGAIARRTRRTTALGAALDVTTDAVGLVVAPLVGVRWGRLPPWYLALALAYPTFQLGLAVRRAAGWPAFPERLRPDRRARFFAGVQMGVVAASLFPLLPRALTWTAATLAMMPTLALFAGEWRTATRPDAPSTTDGDARAQPLDA
jgi:CDP-diacylglycerol---glycerol-3-phosphate 3-phosphatidyltransferase